MSVGPITIFDKSLLQALNLDEAVWFDNFYLANITPLFFVETLADLEKIDAKGRPPEHVVGSLAAKAPLGGLPNVHHGTLCANEMLGHGFKLGLGRPVIAGGQPVATSLQMGIHVPACARGGSPGAVAGRRVPRNGTALRPQVASGAIGHRPPGDLREVSAGPRRSAS